MKKATPSLIAPIQALAEAALVSTVVRKDTPRWTVPTHALEVEAALVSTVARKDTPRWTALTHALEVAAVTGLATTAGMFEVLLLVFY